MPLAAADVERDQAFSQGLEIRANHAAADREREQDATQAYVTALEAAFPPSYIAAMKWRAPSSSVTLPGPGFIEPCIPSPAKLAPTSADWIYELKHDGYRLMVRKADDRVRIYSRRGADFTQRFPRIVEAVRRLKVSSVLIDGEGIVYNDKGMPSFNMIHCKQHDHAVSLVAFDLLELDGEDVRADRSAGRARLRLQAAGCEGQGRHRIQRPPDRRRRGNLRSRLPPGP